MNRISAIELYKRKVLLVSPLDIQVFLMDIPPSKETDREEIIRSRLRALYPGDPGNTVFDYILCGGKQKGEPKSRRKIIVFAAEKELYDLYRGTGQSLVPGISILSLGADKIRAPSKLVILLTPEWAEAARFDNNEISAYVSGYTGGETADLPFISPLYSEGERDTLPVLIIGYSGVYHSGLQERFKNCRSMNIGEAAGGTKIKSRRIFYRHGEGINHKLIISALVLLNCASLVFSLRLVSSRMAEELIRLQNIHREQREYTKEAERLEKEIAEIQDRQAMIHANQGPAIYEIISVIDSCLSKARIQNLIIQEETFNLEAEGEDSLKVFRALEGSQFFTDISLHRAAPSKRGGEQFNISGRINHDGE
jgi:hypothetical protein